MWWLARGVCGLCGLEQTAAGHLAKRAHAQGTGQGTGQDTGQGTGSLSTGLGDEEGDEQAYGWEGGGGE